MSISSCTNLISSRVGSKPIKKMARCIFCLDMKPSPSWSRREIRHREGPDTEGDGISSLLLDDVSDVIFVAWLLFLLLFPLLLLNRSVFLEEEGGEGFKEGSSTIRLEGGDKIVSLVEVSRVEAC